MAGIDWGKCNCIKLKSVVIYTAFKPYIFIYFLSGLQIKATVERLKLFQSK